MRWKWLDPIRLLVSGHDVFLSYHSADAAAYCQRLDAALRESGLVCYHDRRLMNAGDAVRPNIDRATRLSKACVVIVSPNAHTSEYVRDVEVGAFLAAGRTVIPVNVGDAIRAEYWHALQPLSWVDEGAEAVRAGQPSIGLVPSIRSSLRGWRLRILRRLAVVGVFIAALLAASGVLVTRWYDRFVMNQAEERAASRLRALAQAITVAQSNFAGSVDRPLPPAEMLALLRLNGAIEPDADYSDVVMPTVLGWEAMSRGSTNPSRRVFAFLRHSTNLDRVPVVFDDGSVEIYSRPRAFDVILQDSGLWAYDVAGSAPSSDAPEIPILQGIPRPTSPR